MFISAIDFFDEDDEEDEDGESRRKPAKSKLTPF